MREKQWYSAPDPGPFRPYVFKSCTEKTDLLALARAGPLIAGTPDCRGIFCLQWAVSRRAQSCVLSFRSFCNIIAVRKSCASRNIEDTYTSTRS